MANGGCVFDVGSPDQKVFHIRIDKVGPSSVRDEVDARVDLDEFKVMVHEDVEILVAAGQQVREQVAAQGAGELDDGHAIYVVDLDRRHDMVV